MPDSSGGMDLQACEKKHPMSLNAQAKQSSFF